MRRLWSFFQLRPAAGARGQVGKTGRFNMNRWKIKLNRRTFIDGGLRSAGALALTAGIGELAGNCFGANSTANPFAYDVDRLSQIDPKLQKYVRVRTISAVGPEPRRLAIGPQNRLYVACRPGIEIFDVSGGKVGEIALDAPARCVAVAEDGTVYAGLRTHVEVFDGQGRRVASWETPTRKTWLTGLSAGANDLFAADSAARAVYRYDLSGKLKGRIGEKSLERNIPGLIVPSPYLDVKLGHDGLLRINNPGRHCVHVFTADGDLEFSWGKPSLAIEGFCGCCNPVGLAVLPDGRFISCEKGLPRVKVYSGEGVLESVVAGPEFFEANGRPGQNSDRTDGTLGGLDAVVDSAGQVCILDLTTREVHVMRGKG